MKSAALVVAVLLATGPALHAPGACRRGRGHSRHALDRLRAGDDRHATCQPTAGIPRPRACQQRHLPRGARGRQRAGRCRDRCGLRVLAHLHPGEAARIDALADELADTRSEAFLRGRLIGRLLVARAESDGADAGWTGTPPQGPGVWVPTPPGMSYRRSSRWPGPGAPGISRPARSSARVRRPPTAARSSSRRSKEVYGCRGT